MEPAAAVAPAPQAAPTASQPVASPAAPVAPAPGVETPPAAAPEQPERTFSQKEVEELFEKRMAKERRKRGEIEKERDYWRSTLLENGGKVGERGAQPDAPKPDAATAEPKREQYATFEEYLEARADWRAEQKVEKKLQEREERERQRTTQEKEKQGRDQFQKMLKESARGIEDFDDTIAGLTQDDPAASIWSPALEACDAPGKMLHHLIKNPSEAERIASLPPGKQARELIQLETKLGTVKEVKPSNAPAPIKPVAGKANVGDEMPDPSKDPEGWTKWRNRTIAANRGQPRVR